MPGVLMLEALAQAAALLSLRRRRTSSPTTNTVYYFVGIDGARFKRPVEPGDQLHPRGRRSTRMRAASASSRRARTVDDELAVRGRADVHDAPDRLSRPTARRAWRGSIRRRIVDAQAELDAVGRGRPVRGDRRRTCAIGAGTTHRRALRDRRATRRSAATTASSSSARSAARRRTRSTPASRRGWRSATATRSASSAPSTAAPRRTTASRASATTTGSWPTCTSRTTARSATTPILANNAHARRPRARRRLGRSSAA